VNEFGGGAWLVVPAMVELRDVAMCDGNHQWYNQTCVGVSHAVGAVRSSEVCSRCVYAGMPPMRPSRMAAGMHLLLSLVG
jgi:hypothetical protein